MSRRNLSSLYGDRFWANESSGESLTCMYVAVELRNWQAENPLACLPVLPSFSVGSETNSKQQSDLFCLRTHTHYHAFHCR